MHKLKYFLTLATVLRMPCSFPSPLNFSPEYEFQLRSNCQFQRWLYPGWFISNRVGLSIETQTHKKMSRTQQVKASHLLAPKVQWRRKQKVSTREESSELQYLTVLGGVWHTLKVGRRVFYSDSLSSPMKRHHSFSGWDRIAPLSMGLRRGRNNNADSVSAGP